ncbi:MAG: putative SprT family Zn-dependent metalloprotease [Crocinitomicaceae bacterium]|jgi:predicted SprT family Zn-dependent metalloprotease
MLKIKLESHIGYTGKNLDKVNEAIEHLEDTLNSTAFEHKVTHFKSDKTEGGTFHFITYTKWRGRRTDVTRYSNQEIFDKVMNGTETSGEDGVIAFKLKLERGSGGGVVGYTYKSDGIIHTYTKDFNGMDSKEFAAHIFHEYCHLLGFKHSKSTRKDPLRNCYAVPYALGNFISILTYGKSPHGCVYEIEEP